MPPITRFTKDQIIDISYQIVKKEGMKSLNARRIAKELNCSVQPIFHNFASMNDLKEALYKKIYQTYEKYMLTYNEKENVYKQMGLSYIKFAKDYPEFFKIMFMQKTNLNAESFMMSNHIGENVIEAGRKLTGLTKEEQSKFHIKVWFFTHGIACLVSNNTIKINDKEIEELLSNTVLEMLKGYQLKKEEENGKYN